MIPVLSANKNHHSFDQKQINLMVFELSCGGHYPKYVAHLVRYWDEKKYQGNFAVVVSPQFRQRHSDVANLPDNYIDDFQ